MKESDPNYPTITHDEATNYYTFDFGTTDHRYIIAYHYANGWQETKSILIPDLLKNHCMVINKGHRRSLSLIPQQTLSILVKGQLLAQKRNPSHCENENIDDGTKKVVNPTFSLKSIGNTNGEIDPNSIRISNVPDDSYKVES